MSSHAFFPDSAQVSPSSITSCHRIQGKRSTSSLLRAQLRNWQQGYALLASCSSWVARNSSSSRLCLKGPVSPCRQKCVAKLSQCGTDVTDGAMTFTDSCFPLSQPSITRVIAAGSRSPSQHLRAFAKDAQSSEYICFTGCLL